MVRNKRTLQRLGDKKGNCSGDFRGQNHGRSRRLRSCWADSALCGSKKAQKQTEQVCLGSQFPF